jgi:hypothetical protein
MLERQVALHQKKAHQAIDHHHRHLLLLWFVLSTEPRSKFDEHTAITFSRAALLYQVWRANYVYGD